MPNFPSDAELKQVRKNIAKLRGSQGLNPKATALERAKYAICEEILIYMKKKRITQRELAKVLNTHETRVSEIIHYRIEKFTLDRLVSFLQVLKPMIILRVA